MMYGRSAWPTPFFLIGLGAALCPYEGDARVQSRGSTTQFRCCCGMFLFSEVEPHKYYVVAKVDSKLPSPPPTNNMSVVGVFLNIFYVGRVFHVWGWDGGGGGG